MKKTILFFALFLVAICVEAQCPMCKMAAESNMKAGGKAGAGLNAGILYMLAMPYLIVAGIGVWWYRNRKKNVDDVALTDEDPIRWN